MRKIKGWRLENSFCNIYNDFVKKPKPNDDVSKTSKCNIALLLLLQFVKYKNSIVYKPENIL